MSAKELRDLERSYRCERAAILEDPNLSWEKKMYRAKQVFGPYARERDALRGAAEEVWREPVSCKEAGPRPPSARPRRGPRANSATPSCGLESCASSSQGAGGR